MMATTSCGSAQRFLRTKVLLESGIMARVSMLLDRLVREEVAS